MTKEYKYDIAFSLCKQDVKFARDLIAQLNPTIRVFFYENNQEELIAKSGPEAFGKTFNNEARIVVILSRKEWSDSYYTEIVRNAIIDRTSVRNQGYSFLMVIPMAAGETPPWYPSTRIYANPQLSSIEQLARFIEFKLADEGGAIKKLTLEDVHQNLLQRFERKKALVQLQTTSLAASAAKMELDSIKEWTEKNGEILNQKGFWKPNFRSGGVHFEFFIQLDSYLLEIKTFGPDEFFPRKVSAQEYQVLCCLYQVNGLLHQQSMQSLDKQVIAIKRYAYLYNEPLMGWAEMNEYKKRVNSKELAVLFEIAAPSTATERTWHFDLKNPIITEDLIDHWFQELVKHSSKELNKYL